VRGAAAAARLNLLVAGGAGFVGSHLVDRLLAEGHRVDVVDDLSRGSLSNLAEARRSPNGRLSFHQLDIRSPALGDLMLRSRPEVVYLLATPGPDADPVTGAEVAVLGAVRAMEATRRCGAHKVVYACSAAVYGQPDPSDLPLRESHPLRPVTPAGAAEAAVVGYLHAYREAASLEFSALVLGHVYGPRQPAGPVVASFAERLAAGAAGVIHGTGGVTRDFLYVDDAVDALARAAERGGGLVMNIATGRETAIRDLYQAMAARAGVAGPAGRGPARTGEIRRLALDPARASIHLGWRPWTSIAEGTAAVLQWWGAGA
jgi:UDP-glucose 4-epimerase